MLDLDSFLPILIFPQTMAPDFKRGFPSILAFALAAVALVCKICHTLSLVRALFLIMSSESDIADFLHRRQLRQEAQTAAEQPASEVVEASGKAGQE